MKKFLALTATALILAGCSQSDRNGMGSSSGSQYGSDQTTTRSSRSSSATSTNNTSSATTGQSGQSGTSGSGSASGSGSTGSH